MKDRLLLADARLVSPSEFLGLLRPMTPREQYRDNPKMLEALDRIDAAFGNEAAKARLAGKPSLLGLPTVGDEPLSEAAE